MSRVGGGDTAGLRCLGSLTGYGGVTGGGGRPKESHGRAA